VTRCPCVKPATRPRPWPERSAHAGGRTAPPIAEGEASPGERLPLAKDLAAVLGVNKNTVLRALHILREEGLLEFRRGRGITVSGTPQRGAVLARARDLVEFARHHGFGRDEVIQIIESLP
jgi:GntR family transcriptional regulator